MERAKSRDVPPQGPASISGPLARAFTGFGCGKAARPGLHGLHDSGSGVSKSRLIPWHLRRCENPGEQGIGRARTFLKRLDPCCATFDLAQALVSCLLLRTVQVQKCL
jgi:hypothetical protein